MAEDPQISAIKIAGKYIWKWNTIKQIKKQAKHHLKITTIRPKIKIRFTHTVKKPIWGSLGPLALINNQKLWNVNVGLEQRQSLIVWLDWAGEQIVFVAEKAKLDIEKNS